MVTDQYCFLAEQVSHHPPITAYYCKGKSGYKTWFNASVQINLYWGGVSVTPIYNMYVELEGMGANGANEVYEIKIPFITVHNLIFGTLYMDLAGESIIRNVAREDLVCKLTYTEKGWTEYYHYLV